MAIEHNSKSDNDPVRIGMERCIELLLFLQSSSTWVTQQQIYEAVPGYQSRLNDAARRKQFDRDRDYLARAGIEVERRNAPEAAEVVQWRVSHAVPNANDAISLDGFPAKELAALSGALAALNWPRLELFEESSKPNHTAEHGEVVAASVDSSGTTGEVGGIGKSAKFADIAGSIGAGGISEFASLMADAIVESRSVTFVYSSAKRIVDPYRLVLRNGRWYLRASERGELKTFRLDRISSGNGIQLLNKFKRSVELESGAAQDFNLDPNRFERDEAVKIRLGVIAQSALDIAEDLSGEVESFDHNRAIVTSTVTNKVAAYAAIVSWRDHIYEVQPEPFRVEFLSYIESLEGAR